MKKIETTWNNNTLRKDFVGASTFHITPCVSIFVYSVAKAVDIDISFLIFSFCVSIQFGNEKN